MLERWLTAKEIHDLRFEGSGLSVRWIVKHVPCYELAPRIIRFRLSEVDAWIATRTREGVAA